MSRSTSSSSSSDAFDELAAMFMTPSDDAAQQSVHVDEVGVDDRREVADPPRRETPDHPTTSTPLTELLLVGHLPVRANLWLTPYADALAREIGPVALIRLDGDGLTLEILRGRDDWRAEIAGLSIRSAIEFLSRDIRAWVIRPRDIEQSHSRDVIGRVGRLMLLTSADQAASEAAYQAIERIRFRADEDGLDLPALAIAVVGSEPESATWMVRRLQNQCASELGVSIELERVLPRIDSDVQSSVYLRFNEDEVDGAAAVLAMIEKSIDVAGPRTERTTERDALLGQASQRPGAINGRQRAEAKCSEVREERREPIELQACANHGSTENRPSEHVEAKSPQIKLAPKPAQRREQAQQETDEPSADALVERGLLASHVPGLSPVAIRSPRSEHIEFAVDARGNVHLLGTEAHMRELRIVEGWAKEHRELLALALADRAVGADAAIICHLFTSDPADVADLHGTEIKLHVLAPVEVEGRRGWYAAALNR